jgi:hypothetical protein
MNERIEELESQCWEARQYGPPWFDTEKFAELIVRECMEQLVKEGDAWEQFSRNPPEGQETNASAALFAAYRLKEDAVARLEEHFGVDK